MKENYLNKVKIVADIVQQHYEPQRQDRSLIWCYRNFVNKLYPMSERTFWRYINIAVNKLGYEFKDKEDYFYLDDVISKMRPETLEKVKEVANDVLTVKPNGKTKNKVYNEVTTKIGNNLNKGNFYKYVQIAETYLGYNFNFQ
jgi:hypothetical protein